jgi:N-methylhydantoinase A/oxoprolinase/acetone carboxylase beta subunit
MSHRLGVDVGGTFTDLVLVRPDGQALTRKVLSSTGNYADAIVRGARELMTAAGIGPGEIDELIHGTTVATNAILERRGARSGLLTTSTSSGRRRSCRAAGAGRSRSASGHAGRS